jgi:hypothetical protein
MALAACSGSASVDESAGRAASAQAGTASAQAGTANGGRGGSADSAGGAGAGPPALVCDDLDSCCDTIRALAEWQGCPDRPSCWLVQRKVECVEATVAWYRCLVDAFPSSFSCENGHWSAVCGWCDRQAQDHATACGLFEPLHCVAR